MVVPLISEKAGRDLCELEASLATQKNPTLNKTKRVSYISIHTQAHILTHEHYVSIQCLPYSNRKASQDAAPSLQTSEAN